MTRFICSAIAAVFACRAGSAGTGRFSIIFSSAVMTGAATPAATGAASPEIASGSTKGFATAALAATASVALIFRRLLRACRGARAPALSDKQHEKQQQAAGDCEGNTIEHGANHLVEHRCY